MDEKHTPLPERLAKLWEDFQRLDQTSKNLLKRAVTPRDLLEQPAFYGLYRKHLNDPKERGSLLRTIFCLPYIHHVVEGRGLGAALAATGKDGKVKVSEKRVIQLSRIEDREKAMIHLRRLLKLAEPKLDWVKAATSIWWWRESNRRDLLEDYFLSLPAKK